MLCTMCMFGTSKTWECTCGERSCGHIWTCPKCGERRESIRAEVVKRVNMPECRKIGYESEGTAQRVAIKRLANTDGPVELRVYYCTVCHKWHLTKRG